MSAPSDYDARIDVLDILISALKDHEEVLRDIVARFEEIFERAPVGFEVGVPRDELEERRWTLERGQAKEGVIFISGKKIMLIPEEDLPELLRSKLITLAEYDLDTPEKRNALERLFSMLERKKTG